MQMLRFAGHEWAIDFRTSVLVSGIVLDITARRLEIMNKMDTPLDSTAFIRVLFLIVDLGKHIESYCI